MAIRDPLVAPAQGRELTETVLGHHFARPELLQEALTHRSALGGARGGRSRPTAGASTVSNERLEFLGDRVLGLLMAEWLAERFPDEQEGQLGRRHADLVSQPVIAAIAERLGLPRLLSVAPGESRAGVRSKATVLADAMEALLGALYLDAGLEPARAFVRRVWAEPVGEQTAPPKDAKTALQEWLLGRGRGLPEYAVVEAAGPPHDPVFTVAVTAGELRGTGTAGSKRVAERLAAEDLLGRLPS